MIYATVGISDVGETGYASPTFSDTNVHLFGLISVTLNSQEDRVSRVTVSLKISRENKYIVNDRYTYSGTISCGNYSADYSRDLIINNNSYAEVFRDTFDIYPDATGYLPKMYVTFTYDNRPVSTVEVTISVPLKTIQYQVSDFSGYHSLSTAGDNTVYNIYYGQSFSMRLTPEVLPRVTLIHPGSRFDVSDRSSLSGSRLSIDLSGKDILDAFGASLSSREGRIVLEMIDPVNGSVLSSVTLFITLDLDPSLMSPIVSGISLKYIDRDGVDITNSRKAIAGADHPRVDCLVTLCSDVSEIQTAGIILNEYLSTAALEKVSGSLREYRFSCTTVQPAMLSGESEIIVYVLDKRGFKAEIPVKINLIEYQFPAGFISARRTTEDGQPAMNSKFATVAYNYSVYVIPNNIIPKSQSYHELTIRYREKGSSSASNLIGTLRISHAGLPDGINSYSDTILLRDLTESSEYILELIVSDSLTLDSGRLSREYILGVDQTIFDYAMNGKSVSIGTTAPGGSDNLVEVGWPTLLSAGFTPLSVALDSYDLGLDSIRESGFYINDQESAVYGVPDSILAGSNWGLLVISAGIYASNAVLKSAAQIIFEMSSSSQKIWCRFLTPAQITAWTEITQ